MNQEEKNDSIGDIHLMTSIKTPLKSDAFDISDDEKIQKILQKVSSIRF